jgi:hypothetical protein
VDALSVGIERLGPLASLQLPAVDLAIELRRWDDALARIDTLLARNPRNEAWLARRASILAAAGRQSEAHATLVEALALIERRPAHRRGRRVNELERDIRETLEQDSGTTKERP